MTLATIAAQQNNALAAANAAANSAASGTGAATTKADTSRTALTGNFNDFLKLLMTQLKNQDPSNPLDTNQFTTQLVQFASVEQQINANANLTQLIELTQGQQVLQSAQLVGKQVLVQSDRIVLQDGTGIVLQDGTGTVRFDSQTAQPVGIAIYSDAGVKLREEVITAKPGSNDWSWDGRTLNGTRLPDGGYRIAVMGAQADGTTAALPFNVLATATATQREGNTVTLRLGATGVPLSAVQTVLGE